MLDARAVGAELRKDSKVTVVKDLGDFGWVVEVKLDDAPIPAQVAVSGQISDSFVMFWSQVASETVAEAIWTCGGISNVGIASDGEGGYHFRTAIFKETSLPSAVSSSLRAMAVASLKYQIAVLLGDDDERKSG